MTSMRDIAFHAEVDVCAVVYPSGHGPDALLEAFVLRRRAEGRDAVGLIQRRKRCADAPLELALIGDDRAPKVSLPPRAGAGKALETVKTMLSARLRRRPDVLVLNRFGRAEVEGEGLWDVLADAVRIDIPVVIAVPDGLAAIWRRRGAGVLAQARPDADSLERWWRSVSAEVNDGDLTPRFCERAK
jgi:hypothetical protein